MSEDRELLWQVHCARMQEHWGDRFDVSRTAWPKTDAEWRQTAHGAPWDSNVEMARFTIRLFKRLQTICPSNAKGETGKGETEHDMGVCVPRTGVVIDHPG